MLVENSTTLTDWAVSELTTAGIDADPKAVAKYTVALVKKNTDEVELKSTMCEELLVFLGENTDSFVSRIIQVVKDKSYLQPAATSSDLPEDPQIQNSNGSAQHETQDNSESISRQVSKTQESEEELSDDDRDHRRTNKRSRSRSRSATPPQHQHSRHKPSLHRRLGYNNRGGGHRGGQGYPPRGQWRGSTRSRLGRAGYHNNEYFTASNRRFPNGQGGGGPPARRRSRSPPPRHSLSPHRRRSRSPRRSLSPRKSLSPRRPPLDLLATLDPVKPSTQKDPRKRCRDYDEKGLCLKGDHCPFLHGDDAVVMNDVNSLQQLAPAVGQSLNPSAISSAPSALHNQQAAPIVPLMSNVTVPPVEPYNPEVPRMWTPQMNPAMRQPMPGPGGFPMMSHPRGPMPHFPMQSMPRGPGPRMRHMGPRPGFRPRFPPGHPQMRPGVSSPAIYDPNRATLEVKNLPEEFNTIVKLNEHFSKFGTIINLQVQYKGQPGTALVTFSTHHEAKSANQNPEPLFNNRFIKMFWHNEDGPSQGQNSQQGPSGRPSVKSRLGVDAKPSGSEPANKKPRVEPNMNPATLRLNKSVPTHKFGPPVNKKAELVRKHVEQKTQALLQEQIEQQKELLDRAENCTDRKVKSELVKTIKALASNIERMKEDLRSRQAPARPKPSAATKKTRELLDAEMDLHQRRQAGEDTATLKNQLDSLKLQAASLGIRGGRGRGRGGHYGARPSPATQAPPPPTALTVLGFKAEEKEAIISHFSQYGPVTAKEFKEDGAKTSVVIEYTKANDAKVASIHGAKFGAKNLILKWYKPAATSQNASASTSGDKQAAGVKASSVASSKATVVERPVQASASERLLGPDVQGTDSVLEDADELVDLLADDGNDEGDIDEALLLGDEEYEEDDDSKRSW